METDDVLALVQEVAAAVVTPRFRALAGGEVRRKQLHAPVTVADREAEELLTRALRDAYPGAVVLGEEAVAADPSAVQRFRAADHAFTVDPVDGTRQFVRGSPDHAVMVAELRGGEVVRSWIWQPQHERSYVAERGAGAWCGSRRLSRAPLSVAAASDGWARRASNVLRLRRTSTCCGVDYPRIVEGAADVAVYLRPRPWDHAPGSLLLREAGGHVATLDGGPYRPQGPRPRVLVAAPDRPTYDVATGLLPARLRRLAAR